MENNLSKVEYDELVQFIQEKKISTVDFINAQSELTEDYKLYCEENRLSMNEKSSKLFLTQIDHAITNNQNILS